MEEILLRDGDQVPNGAGDFCRTEGAQALLQRVLFRLTARRGAFPFLPETGSQLYLLGREKPAARQALCQRYVQQALEGEDVAVTEVTCSEQGDTGQVTVRLEWRGEPLEVTAQFGRTVDADENDR